MSRRLLPPVCLLGLLLAWRPSPALPEPPAGRPAYKSPLGVAVDADGSRAYVALHTAGAVAVVDLRAGKVLREVAVGNGPHDVALAGDALFVTCEQDDTLVRIDVGRQAVTGRWPTGQAPRGAVALPDGSRVWVACHDAQALWSLDIATGAAHTVGLPGWPDRLALQPGEGRPCVQLLSTQPGEALVSVVDAGPPPRVLHTERLAGVSNARGLAIRAGAPAAARMTLQRPRTNVPATQVAQGWVFTNAVATLDPQGLSLHGGAPEPRVLDDPARSYADPEDVALPPGRDLAFVACGGADAVLAVRTDKLPRAGYGSSSREGEAAQRADDLAASRRYVAARLATGANPRRMALSGDGRTLVVSNHLADSLTVIDVDALRVVRYVSLGGPPPDAARRGEVLFHSGRMTFQGQFTCASCHPGGGSDGLAWDLPRDGVGNFVNTRALWGARDTAPYGWHGTSPTLADRVAGTLRTLHQHEPQGTEVADLVAYLETLSPPRPLPRDPAGAAARARGQALFEGKGKCTRCHGGAAFDDTLLHDVGTRVPGDFGDCFDTPSLRGLGRTAPYLHHGRAATLEEVFTAYNPARKHGAAHELSREELADLVAYLKGL
jgi:hypothetical protein